MYVLLNILRQDYTWSPDATVVMRYIPSGRIFGLIDKEIKIREILLLLEDQREVFSHYATVILLGVDWEDLDGKQAKDKILKPPN